MDILQLALTPIVLTACILVLALYIPHVKRNGMPTTYSQWLMLGIVFAFSAKVCDQLYASLFVVNNGLFCKYGAIASIFLRQLPTVASAICHIKAAHMYYTLTNKNRVAAPLALKAILLLASVTAIFLVGTKIVRGL